MALQLFKLVMTATTSTNAVPTEKRYFHILSSVASTVQSVTLPASTFVNDNNSSVVNITPKATNNGYYMLYINGELQQSSLYTVSSTQVTIVTQAHTIPTGATIALAVTNFAPTSSTTVTG